MKSVLRRLSFVWWCILLCQTVLAATFSTTLADTQCETVDGHTTLSGFGTGLTDFTLTFKGTLPAEGEVELVRWNAGANEIYFTLRDGTLQGYYDTPGTQGNSMEGTAPVAIPTGARTIKICYDRARNGEQMTITSGVYVWIDGTQVYRQTGLRWENEVIDWITLEQTALTIETITLSPGWKADITCPGATVKSFIPADATLLADGSFRLGEKPLTFTDFSTGAPLAFTLSLLAKLPDETGSGVLMSTALTTTNKDTYTTSTHSVQAECLNTGYTLRYNQDQSHPDTVTTATTPDTQWHVFTFTYNDNAVLGDRGSRLAIDGIPVVTAGGIVWSGGTIQTIAVGDTRSSGANPLKGLRIQAIHLTLHEATLPEDPFGMAADLPTSVARFPTAMKLKLYNSAYRNEDGTFTVPDVTLAGKTLSETDAYFAALCFDLSDGDNLTCGISAIAIGEKGITFTITSSHTQTYGTWSFLGGTLNGKPWERLLNGSAPLSPTAQSVTLPFESAGECNSFKFRIESEEGALGPVGAFSNDAAACDPFPAMPSTVSTPLTFTTTLVEPGHLTAQDSPLILELKGEGVASSTLAATLSDGTNTFSGTVTLLETEEDEQPKAQIIFNDAVMPDALNTELTLTLSGHTHGGITVTKSSWSGAFLHQHRRIAAQLATNLVTDGFVTEAQVKEAGWTPHLDTGANSSTNNDQLFYRIPAIATDGEGMIQVAYDVRYGGGDLGDFRCSGIDLGGNTSTDGGKTWSKPFLAVDVPNFRGPGDPRPTDRSKITKELDIGDAAMLYDPKTETFWLMGITGGGLSYVGGEGSPLNDCVFYTRSRKENTWKAWTGGEDGGRSVKQSLVTSLGRESVTPGILQGPGHGLVTRHTRKEGDTILMPAGTLVFPMQGFVNGGTGNAQCFAAYSTDSGKTWQATGLTPAGTNAQENCVIELDDGSWLLMCKGGTWGAGKGTRLFYRTTDFKQWTALKPDTNIIHVQGSALRIGTHADGASRYVKCHQLDPNTRAKLTLIFGRDLTGENTTADSEGIAWDCGQLELHREATFAQGYNTLCLIDEKTLGVCYESYGIIWFERIDISDYLK